MVAETRKTSHSGESPLVVSFDWIAVWTDGSDRWGARSRSVVEVAMRALRSKCQRRSLPQQGPVQPGKLQPL